MHPGPRITGDPQLSLFMNVGRSSPERPKGNPLEPGKYSERLAWLRPRNGLGSAGSPFVTLSNSTSSHGRHKFSLARRPCPRPPACWALHSAHAFAVPSTWNACQAISSTWPTLPVPSRGSTHVTSLEPALTPTAELAAPSSIDS